MTTRYRRVVDPAEISQHINELGAQSLVVDIEPLIAFWDTDQPTLQDGVTPFLEQITSATTVRALVFATNSTRTLPLPAAPALHIGYLASARKPFRLAPYRELPTPGVVIGDQVATDGILARRLVLHYCPNLPHIPRGPWVMRQLRPLHALLFHSS